MALPFHIRKYLLQPTSNVFNLDLIDSVGNFVLQQHQNIGRKSNASISLKQAQFVFFLAK